MTYIRLAAMIVTSERDHIRDPRVRELADGIIAAQVREIGEMQRLIADLEVNPPADAAPDLAPRMSQAEAAGNN